MRYLLLAAVVVGFALVGCTKDSTTTNKSPSTTAAAGVAAAAGGQLEIACAHCVYKTPGVAACAPAVKMGDKVLLLTGAGVDMKTADICKAAKKATIEGKVDGDKYVATKVDIAK